MEDLAAGCGGELFDRVVSGCRADAA